MMKQEIKKLNNGAKKEKAGPEIYVTSRKYEETSDSILDKVKTKIILERLIFFINIFLMV